MLFRLLGPLEVNDGDGPVPLGEGRQRAVLALLLLHRNEPVSTDRLIDELWGEAPPATAAKVLQNQVRALRRALGDREGRRLQTHGRAYALRVEPGELDTDRFERLVREGGQALADERPAEAGARLHEALAMWRGPPLADLAYEAFAQAEIARLEERRTVAHQLRIDADLALGRHSDLVAELDALVAQHPLREHPRAQRMLALYRCGRQAEALEAFRDARRLLIDEVGVEPGAELRGLHEAMLRQDPSLELPSARLPPELDEMGAPPLEGRDRELDWLRERWARARAGAGGLVVVIGAAGMGKSRLAAALAHEARDGGASVLYVIASAHPDAFADALLQAREAPRETLVVVDDADAGTGMRDVVRDGAAEIADRPVLVLVAAESSERFGDVPDDERLDLDPLGLDAVRRIASAYAPAGAVDETRAAALLEASGGVPAAVHEVASTWARNEARRRVAASAPRTAVGRTELRLAEAALADGVVDLQAARAGPARPAGHRAPVVCPFKGLASFDAADAAYFFGRERLVAELVARSVGAPLLAVVGPSGSGKSSVTKAGLMPALADGVLPGSETWRQIVIRPGEHPSAELRRAGVDGGGRGRTVLVVDQFEEAFTACRDEAERAAFIDALTRARHPAADLVVLALRADFYWRCAAYPALARHVGANHVLVGPMQRDELRGAIELPAQRAGLDIEPALVDALLADVEAEPGGLPLLSAALLELWQRREGNRLRRATYELTGGVRGAVGRLAEDAYGRMDATQQDVARSVLLRLAGEDPAGVVVRRRVALTELEGHRDDDVARVLDLLAERRLITMSATTAEVAHEALLREWPRLRGWLDEDAQGRRIRRRLADAARDWDERGRDPGDLYRGARLVVASEWRAGHEGELNSVERAFLDAGRAAAERAHRRLQLALAGVAALLAVAVLGGTVALHQRSAARDEALIAQAQRISAQALSERVLDRSLLFARQGVALADSPVTRGNLLSALLREPAAAVVVQGEGDPLAAIDVGPRGRVLAVGRRDGGVRLVDAATGRPLGRPLPTGPAVTAVRISPDGTRVAVLGDGFQGAAFIALFDARSHRRIGLLDYGFNAGLLADTGTVAFSPDSRVLIADYNPYGQPGKRRYVARWDARTGRRLGPPRPVATATDRGRTLAGFIAGGRRIVTSSAVEDRTVIRDAVTLQPVRRFASGGRPADVSADGRMVALFARDRTGRLLDLATGAVRPVDGRGDAPFVAMRFTPDARRLVTVDEHGRLAVRATTGDGRVSVIEPSAGRVTYLAVAPDGRTAYTAGGDGAIVGWDLTGAPRLGRPFDVGAGVPADLVAMRTEGAAFAVAGASGEVDLLDARTLRRTGRIMVPGTRDSLRLITASPDGRTLAVGTSGGAVAFADVATGRLRAAPSSVHVGRVLGLAFDPGGRWLASSGDDGSIYIWDGRRAKPARLFIGLSGRATSLSISPDGSRLAATVVHSDGTGELDILRMPRPALVARAPALVGTQSRFSRDGRLLFYADRTGRVWTLDTRTWAPQGPPLGVPGEAGRFAVSPDDRTIAITAGDGRTQLWDVASRRPIGDALPGVFGAGIRTAFIDGGAALVTLDRRGRGYVWDVDPRSWARRACAVAGRTLTRAEWRAALPGRDYAPACRRP